ncbi:hypothetical protein NMG60_11001619 [Bertholletia excelsa]
MASNKLLIFAIVAAALASVARAKEFKVGDDSGWTIDFNYIAWAQDKVFRVGDTLVFKYEKSSHKVHKLNNSFDFKNCNIPPSNEGLTSCQDQIML